MVRSPRYNYRKHQRALVKCKGFWGWGHTSFKLGYRRLVKAWQKSAIMRRSRDGKYKQMYIMRINAASREHRINYSRFITGIRKDGIWLNRKMLANFALFEPYTFKSVAEQAKFVSFGYNTWTKEDYFRMHKTGQIPGGIEPDFEETPDLDHQIQPRLKKTPRASNKKHKKHALVEDPYGTGPYAGPDQYGHRQV